MTIELSDRQEDSNQPMNGKRIQHHRTVRDPRQVAEQRTIFFYLVGEKRLETSCGIGKTVDCVP